MTDPGAAAVRELFRGLAASNVSDALDHLGVDGQVPRLRSLARCSRLFGPAFTVRFVPCAPGEGALGDYVDEVPAGAVVVLDNAGRTSETVWGEVLTQTARARGLAGTVVDGFCRDADSATALEYPIFALGSWMRTGNSRVRAAAIQTPVTLAGTPVRPGDFVLGDGDGVVVIPAERAEEIAGVARRIHDMEANISEAIKAGETVASARARFRRPALHGTGNPSGERTGGSR
ncbi:MAG TPA: RraA family protein [Amycolatopsis sp.]|nr:RraA family protein [Amycolatopsis sp.]